MPRFYFDFAKHKRYFEIGETPWTPTLSVFFGLDLALDKLLEEGMEKVFQRHSQVAQAMRNGARALGLRLLVADERYASNTVTSVLLPEGVDGGRLQDLLQREHGVVLAGGQGPLQGKIFRVGHMGYCTQADIQGVLTALKAVLPKVGGSGVHPARAPS
jgi:aspartate aminotransferase-like enzyme